MLRHVVIAALLAGFAPTVCGAAPERETVAILPTSVFRAAPENAPVLDDAFRASLSKQGYRLVASESVRRAVSDEKVHLPGHIAYRRVASVGRRAGAELVVYPRLLGIGEAPPAEGVVLDPAKLRLVMIVAVIESATGKARHVYQVEHIWTTPNPEAEKPVVTKEAALAAVEKALDLLYHPRQQAPG